MSDSTAPQTPERHIVAMGGGGFSMEPENPSLDEYLLRLSGKEKPKVCFVPTASGDAPGYIINFYAAFSRRHCVPSHLPLLAPITADPRSLVLEQDVIYVGGGNTKNLIALWRAWGLDAIFREAWEQGIVLGGVSAGSICWFEQGVTDSLPGALTALPCLGYLEGSNCPHYDGETERRPSYHRLMSEEKIMPGYAADDGAALHYIGTRLDRAISSRPNAKVYRVEKDGDEIRETPLETHYLGSRPPEAGKAL